MSNPITDLLDILHKENLTTISNELETALKILVDSVNNIEPAIQKELRKSIDNKDYDKVQTLSQIPDKVKECSDYINDLLEDKPLNLSSNNTSKAFMNIDENTLEKHSLFDSPVHTKPYYYTLDNERYDLERFSWKYFLYGLLDTLWNKDRKPFEKFKKGIEIKNPPNLCFYNSSVKDAHKIANTGIYVKFGSCANESIKYASILLKEYGIDPNRLSIYWINRKENENDDDEEVDG